MGSKTELRIPTIDLTKPNLKPGTNLWNQSCKQARQALEEYGCFEVIYDKVPLQLHNSVFASLEDLSELPLEIKKKKTSDKPYHSYLGQYKPLPLYESSAIDSPNTLQGAQLFTNTMWPQGNNRFCESTYEFSKLVAELNELLTRMVFDSYGVAEKTHESHIAETTYLLRCFKYRARQKDETELGFHSHTDLTFTSILHQDDVKGLQIKSKDGQWIDVPPSPSSFVFLAGDALMAWSNDRLRSCEHRVIIKEYKARCALGFFAFRNGIIHVPEELVDEEHPLQYKPFNHFDLLSSYRSDASNKFLCPIKAYCGISQLSESSTLD